METKLTKGETPSPLSGSDGLFSPLASFSFGLESASEAERSVVEQLLRRGVGAEATARTEALHKEFGHGLYEFFSGTAPPGLSGVREPLEWYRDLHTNEEWAAVTLLAAQMPSLEKACELSVCIPVAAAEEPLALLRNTLYEYARQSISPERFEVVLFLNWPDSLSAEQATQVGFLREGVSLFAKEFPNLRLRACASAIPASALSIGFLRKLVHDVVLQRELARADESRSLYHFRGDADVRELPLDFVERRLKLHARFSHAGCLRGDVDYPMDELSHDPCLLVGLRLDQVLSRWIAAQLPQSIWGGGPNSSFSAARYAAVSGYSRFDRRAEDSRFDFRAAGHQGNAVTPRAMRLGARQRMMVSARRLLTGAEHGVAPACLWVTDGEHAFEKSNSPVRMGIRRASSTSLWEKIHEGFFGERLRMFISDTVAYRFEKHPDLVPRLCTEVLPYFGVRASPRLGALLDASQAVKVGVEQSNQVRDVFVPLIDIQSIELLKDWLTRERRELGF